MELINLVKGEGIEFNSTCNQVQDGSGTIDIRYGILVESDGLCTIYDMDEKNFKLIYTTRFQLNTMLAIQDLRMKDLEEDERFCSECRVLMREELFFESDATQYCSEECLTKVMTWDEYLANHDNGNASWTDWHDCWKLGVGECDLYGRPLSPTQ